MKYIYYFLLVLWFIPASAQKSETARYLESIGLVNIAEADSSIIVDLMYTRADNFTGKVLYEDLHEAYLHPDAMKGLLLAQQELLALSGTVVLELLEPLLLQPFSLVLEWQAPK